MRSVLSIKEIGLNKLFILYLFILCLLASVVNFSQYNYVVILSFSFLQILYLKNKLAFVLNWKFVLMESSLFFMGLFFNTRLEYTIIDMITAFFVISCLYIAYYSKINNRFGRIVIRTFSVILMLNILFAFLTDRYDAISGTRYLGLFYGSNVTMSIICVLSAVIWELSKRSYTANKQKIIFLCLVVSYVFMLFFAQTRSALIFLPYWIYHALKQFSMKYVLLTTLVLVSCLVWNNMNQSVFEKLRLEEDGSFYTRASFYEMMMDGIVNNHFIIPHGSYASYELLRKATGEEGMSPHNDLLRYLYDWGILFFLFLSLAIGYFKKLFILNKSVFLLTIGVLSGCLHNILFSPYIWIPYILFLSIYSKRNYVSSSKKI